MTATRPRVLLITQFATRFHREIFHGIVTYVHQHTNWRLTCRSQFNAAEQRKLQPAGVLSLVDSPRIGELALDAGIPFVRAGSPVDDPRASSVSVDENAIGTMAAEYLASLGLKHFAYVGHAPWPFVHERLANLTRAVAAMGYGPVHHVMGAMYDRRRRGRFEKDMATMLQRLPRPCGLLAANDALGVEIVATCGSLGLRVPDDIAVLGIDDDELACELSEVPLSSVKQPLSAIGYEAARLLHQHMEQPDKPATQLYLPPLRVVPRASSDLIAISDADVVAALRLINEHLAEPINVDWLIRHLAVARRSLERKFKGLVGRTILEQIHHVRFRKARELLAESDLALDLVAQRSGFANARWMADRFRHELDLTPLRFRRQFRTEA